jgi:hypothetical protein
MPIANRVQPDGSFAGVPARGAFMGNRGCLHRDDGTIFKRLTTSYRAWITCTLHVKPGRGKHPLLVPGRYTPLFFLDEAVACAAGHRPCAECRRAVYRDFTAAWAQVFGSWPGAKDADALLHNARTGPRQRVAVQDLPEGAFFWGQDRAHLVREGAAWGYLGTGYAAPQALPTGEVAVLTPAPLVAVMRAGWRPAFSAAADRPNW